MDSIRTTEVVDVTPWQHYIYHNAEEFWSNSSELHHAYLIYRTLRGDYKHIFKPDAVFYVGKSPAAYLKKVRTNEISDQDVKLWQRFLWNQSVVPMLIVKSRKKTYVYTANTTPVQKDNQQRIIDILDDLGDVAEKLELEQIWNLIESGMIYKQKPEAFYRYNSVDQYLLRNLNSTALKLAQTQKGTEEANLEFAHYFLTRLLFVCYLIERGMVQGKHLNDEHLKKIQPDKENQKGYFLRNLFKDVSDNRKRCDLLCELFEYIKDHFNGSLFPKNISVEKKFYNHEFIEIINNFLQGHETGTGQMRFWAYDFSVIPIETISSIWESFLGEQGKLKTLQENTDSRRETGAYYTPLHLAELTVDIALEDIEEKTGKKIHELKVLDPACGSGVFLVSLFGRIAESYYRKIRKNTGIEWARKLKPKLNQLYGIDISPTSCHITCFSLYLAYLEWLDPNDVEYLCKHNEKLPPLLANTREDSWDTIYEDNLFNPELSFKENDFDIIIGNPPWVSRGKQKDEYFPKWQKKNPQKICPGNQIVHGFMWETPDYLLKSGIACLLLPSSVLFNSTTNIFQERWLQTVNIERVVNFSDLRFILFPSADHPCVTVRFNISENKNDEILYESPKADILSQKSVQVYVREEDTVMLSQKEILRAAKNNKAPIVWKSHYWGSWRDQRLLSRLCSLTKLSHFAGEIEEGKLWIKGQGIQVAGGDPNEVWWDDTTPYLESGIPFSLVVCKKDFSTIKKANIPTDTVHRPRQKALFVGPKVLLAKGSRRVIFCTDKVVFRDTFTSIASITGSEEDIKLLRFLAVVLGSDLIYYYLFHTNSNLGIYRPQIFPEEFLSVPFYLPKDASDPHKAKEIINTIADVIKIFEEKLCSENWFGQEDIRSQEIKKIRDELEPLVRNYYNIDKYESMLIDDTLKLAVESFHPSQNQTNISTTLREPEIKDCKIYTETLCEMLNNFGKGSNFKVNGEVLKGLPYSVVCVTLTNKIIENVLVSSSNEKLSAVIKRIESFLEEKKDRFVFCKNLKIFDGDNLYLLKPMQMRFWSRTAALNDADEIAGAIISSRRGN